MKRAEPLSRRTVLRGLGTAIALPWLEAMASGTALAGGAGGHGPGAPAHGIFLRAQRRALPDWIPQETGSKFTLPATLQPLAPFRDDLLVLDRSGPAQRAKPWATAPATTPARWPAF